LLNEPLPGKTIAIVSHFGWGIYHYRLDLVRALVRAGWNVVAIADWRDGPFEEMIRAEGVRTASMTLTRARFDPLGDLRTVLQLVRLYRSLKPNVAQHFHTRPMILGALAARFARVPKIVNCVTGLGSLFGGKLNLLRRMLSPLYRLAFGGRVVAVFQNSSDHDYMVASRLVVSDRAFVIAGSGVDMEALQPDPVIRAEDRNIVVMASRLIWSKGVREFEGAVNILKPQFPHIRFVLAGGLSGRYGKHGRDDVSGAWLREAAMRNGFEWLGQLAPSDVEKLYRRAAAVVLPSFYPEGIPRCLIEGAAAGAPIVTTDTPGCRETVIQGVSGYLCAPRSTEHLAQSIFAILATPGAVARMGQASRRHAVDRFDIRKVSAAFIELYSAP
jgi:glycosyltransferase involved in cell wall biosynthesis